jgi:hypothetical protein
MIVSDDTTVEFFIPTEWPPNYSDLNLSHHYIMNELKEFVYKSEEILKPKSFCIHAQICSS